MTDLRLRSKIFSISLLVILSFPLTGCFCWLQVRKALVKQEVKGMMREGVEEGVLVLLKFTPEQSATLLMWEQPREFEYRGMMYDVFDSKIIGDTVYYRCRPDHEESALNNLLASLSDSTCPVDMQLAKSLMRLMTFMQMPFLAGSLLYPVAPIPGSIPYLPGMADPYQSVKLSPPDPPPWVPCA